MILFSVPARVVTIAFGCMLSVAAAQRPPDPLPPIVPAATLTTPASPIAMPNAEGFIQRWLVLEPLNVEGQTQGPVRAGISKYVLADEGNALPHDGETVTVAGSEAKWHALDTRNYNFNLFQFARSLGKPSNNVLFWVETVVHSPMERKDIRLAIGSNASSVWWLNGQEVVGIYGDRQTVIDDGVSKRLTLKKGDNVLRAAIVNGSGATDFCARFLDAEDKPLKGYTISLGQTVSTYSKRPAATAGKRK